MNSFIMRNIHTDTWTHSATKSKLVSNVDLQPKASCMNIMQTYHATGPWSHTHTLLTINTSDYTDINISTMKMQKCCKYHLKIIAASQSAHPHTDTPQSHHKRSPKAVKEKRWSG